MNFRHIVYCIYILIIIVFQMYKQIAYCFETHEKLRTHSTIQIGKEPGSYSLPDTPGQPGQTLRVDGSGKKLIWSDIKVPNYEGSYSDPLLKTSDQCPAGTMFLPMEPFFYPHRGYCVATTNGDWSGVLGYIPVNEGGFYCEQKFGIGAYLPPTLLYWPYLWSALSNQVKESKFWNKFTSSERIAIDAFASAVKEKPTLIEILNDFIDRCPLILTLITIKYNHSDNQPDPFFFKAQRTMYNWVDPKSSSVYVMCVR